MKKVLIILLIVVSMTSICSASCLSSKHWWFNKFSFIRNVGIGVASVGIIDAVSHNCRAARIMFIGTGMILTTFIIDTHMNSHSEVCDSYELVRKEL